MILGSFDYISKYIVQHMINGELNELPSKQNYAIFDRGHDTCDASDIQQNLTKLLKTYPDLEKISDKMRNALCFVYNQSMTKNINSEHCDYLYFWLGNIIYNNMIYILNFTSVIYVINFILQNKEGWNICKFDKYNNDREEFMEIKKLFDYSKDYNKLKHVITSGSCNADYADLLNNYVFTYSSFELKCSNFPNVTKHCKYFNELFEDKDPKKLSCNSQYNNYKSVTQKQDHRGVAESRVKTLEQTTVKQPQELPRSAVHTGLHEDANRQDLNHVNSEFHHSDIKDPNQSDIIDFSASSSSKNMVIASLVVGITVLSFVLCKFTPVGYWLKKALVGKPKRKGNIIIDSNITDDYIIPDDLDSSRRFNIRYSNIY
ncbi:variable surface protein [Plasmodium gonderi]|uniref:Variable surface protein n=1 Tax=Plasmodium gonderi TaxID=77519 RepID=A0A1Y1JPY1_PLAGO|nr:variable surface protein [Plasmodium gonderi]GAW84541.1 variable surface protein [Plasmodium gonderi]